MQLQHKYKEALSQSLSMTSERAHTDSTWSANVTYRYHIDECSFSGVLKSHQCKFHLLFPKEGPEPVQKPVYERQHLGCHRSLSRFQRLYVITG